MATWNLTATGIGIVSIRSSTFCKEIPENRRVPKILIRHPPVPSGPQHGRLQGPGPASRYRCHIALLLAAPALAAALPQPDLRHRRSHLACLATMTVVPTTRVRGRYPYDATIATLKATRALSATLPHLWCSRGCAAGAASGTTSAGGPAQAVAGAAGVTTRVAVVSTACGRSRSPQTDGRSSLGAAFPVGGPHPRRRLGRGSAAGLAAGTAASPT